MVHVASIVGALSGCRGMAWFSRLCVRLTGLSQLRHGKIPFSHMEGVPTLCPEIPIYTPGRFAFPFLILFLAYIGACADWRGSPALSKALEAVGGKGLGWVCSVLGTSRSAKRSRVAKSRFYAFIFSTCTYHISVRRTHKPQIRSRFNCRA